MTKASLPDNPPLTTFGRLVFRIIAASGSVGTPPEPMPLLRSHRAIWTADARSVAWSRRLVETLDQWSFFLRPPLLVLSFLLSSLTTAWSVNILLQQDAVARIIDTLPTGGAGETIRHGLAWICGLLLSVLILNGNKELLRSVASTGWMGQGIGRAWRRHPFRLSLMMLLTLYSIHATCAGWISRMAWQPEVTRQMASLQEGLTTTLETDPAPSLQPASLSAMQMALKRRVAALVTRFEQLPVRDDLPPHAIPDLRDPLVAMRYWSLHFVIHGGFEKGVNAVAALVDHPLAATVDRLLAESGLPLFLPFRERVADVVQRNALLQQQSVQQLQQELRNLQEMSPASGRVSGGFLPFFGPEPSRIDRLVQRVTSILENSRNSQTQQLQELQKRVDAHVALLQQIEKSLGGQRPFQRIEVIGSVPDLPLLHDLRSCTTWRESWQTHAGMIATLGGEPGTNRGWMLLAGILLLAILIDLGDVVLFAPGTARLARRDKDELAERTAHLQQWEEAFVYHCQQILRQPTTLGITGNLLPVTRDQLRQALHDTLRRLDFRTRDPGHFTWKQSLADGLQFLIYPPQSEEAIRCRARARAVRAFVTRRESLFPRLMEKVLPELQCDWPGDENPFRESTTTPADALPALPGQHEAISSALSGGTADTKSPAPPDDAQPFSTTSAPLPEQQRLATQQFILEEMYARFGELRQMILKRNKTLWETLSAPSGPTKNSPGRIADQSALEAATTRAAAILEEVDAIGEAALPPDDQTLERLRILQEESRRILIQINQLLPGVYH
ncbi:MAG: hypothetical protein HQL64_08200 [Magnetococcales bacterium]|nr:hypothetical protein [Magnetococcales bacterium]